MIAAYSNIGSWRTFLVKGAAGSSYSIHPLVGYQEVYFDCSLPLKTSGNCQKLIYISNSLF
jgi:hypothetical protein